MTRQEFLELRDLVLAVPVAANVAAWAVRLCRARPSRGRAVERLVREFLASSDGRGCADASCWPARPGRSGRPRCADGRRRASRHGPAVLRHRIIVNHRAVGDGVASRAIEQLLEHLAGSRTCRA